MDGNHGLEDSNKVIESRRLAIKYCVFSAFAAFCSAVFAVVGLSLVTEHRLRGLSSITVVGFVFTALAALSSILAFVFKGISKYYYL